MLWKQVTKLWQEQIRPRISTNRIIATATVVAALATVIYAFYAHRQWQVMRGQLQEMKLSRERMNEAILAANRSAQAAETANKNAIESERPWIGVSDFSPATYEPGTTTTAILVVANGGKRPSLVKLSEFAMNKYRNFPKSPEYKGAVTRPSQTLLVPGVTMKTTSQAFNLTTQEIIEMQKAGEILYIYGHLEYIDVGTQEPHTTHVCEYYIPLRKMFVNCPFYNDAN